MTAHIEAAMPLPEAPTLADIRAEIDRLDTAMHALLMQRGEVIDRLIAVKRTGASGSAFRPAREAEVLRRIVERHRGLLPLDTVESIWRVIISTFTFVQAPHSVHAETSGAEAAVRDSARFHFGFTVPFVEHDSAAAVIEAVDRSRGDLGMFRIAQRPETGSWWRMLEDARRPKIIARLPFVERPDHPAGLPVYVVSRPLEDATVREVIVASLSAERWRPAAALALERIGVSVVTTAASGDTLSVLVTHEVDTDPGGLARALVDSGCGQVQYREVGSHSASVVPPTPAA